ncbi:MAG: hypothetical protein JNM95_02495 [Chitinophagaceae bacterium]|nr:hypothetical protein [Chitinophagaceae bacterium]
MNKLIILPFLLTTTIFSHAQKSNSYLMLNFNVNAQSVMNSMYPYRTGVSNVGIQWIKNRKNNQAFRFGISGYSHTQINTSQLTIAHDTNIYHYQGYGIRMPKLSVGMEFQKKIHRDVVLYGGMDVQVGAARTRTINFEEVSTALGSYRSSVYYTTANRDPIAIGATFKPFVGIRANWNRFVFSYELSMPMNVNSVLGKSTDFNTGHIQHTISIGYMFGKVK